MAKIKLYLKETLKNGIQRFQSQLCIGKDIADFIKEENGQMCVWGSKGGSFCFIPFHGEYEIVENISDMKYQEL